MIKKKKLPEGPRPAYFRELSHPFEGRKLLLPTGQRLDDCSFLDTTCSPPCRDTQGRPEGTDDQTRLTSADLRACQEKGREQCRLTRLQERFECHEDRPLSTQVVTVHKTTRDEARQPKILTEPGSSVWATGGLGSEECTKNRVEERTRQQVLSQVHGDQTKSCKSTDRNQLEGVSPVSGSDTHPYRNTGADGDGWDTNSSSLHPVSVSPHSSKRSRANYISVSGRHVSAVSELHHPLKPDSPGPSRCTSARIQKFTQDGGSAYRIRMLPLGNEEEGLFRQQIQRIADSPDENLNAGTRTPLDGKNGNKIRRGDIPKRQARESDAQNNRPVIAGEGKDSRSTPSTDLFHKKQLTAKHDNFIASGEPRASLMAEQNREDDRLVVGSSGKKVPLRLIDHLEATEGRSSQGTGSCRYRDVTARVDNIHLSPHGHAAAGVSPRELDHKIRSEAARSFNPINSKGESARNATPRKETDDDTHGLPNKTGHSDSRLELSCLGRAGQHDDDSVSLSEVKAKIRRGTLTRYVREGSFSNNSSADLARQSCTPRGEPIASSQDLRESGFNTPTFNCETDKQVCKKSLVGLASPGQTRRSPGQAGKEAMTYNAHEGQSSSRKGGEEAAVSGKSGPTFFVVRRVVRGEGTTSSKAVAISHAQISQKIGQLRENELVSQAQQSRSTKQAPANKGAARQADPVPSRGDRTRPSTSAPKNPAPQPSQEKAPLKKTPRIIKARTDFSNNNHMDDLASPPTTQNHQSQWSDHAAADFHPSPAFSIVLQNENHSNRQSTKSVKNGRGENVRSEISVSAVPQNSQPGYCFSRSGFVVDPSGLCCMEELAGILEEARVNSWKRCNAEEEVDVESLLADPLEECLNFTFLGEYIRSLWRHEMLCDVKVVVGHKQYLVHKLVLAAYSSLFCPATPRPEPTHVYNIPNSSPRAVEQIFAYMYSATMTLTDDMLEDVLIAAKLMGVTDVVDVIKRILSQPTLDNVELYNDIIKRSGLDISFLDQQKIYQQSFGDMKNNVAFLGIAADELQKILMDPDVLVTSEMETIEVIISWIEYNYLQRIGYLGTMLRQVSYESIAPGLLVQLADKYKHIFDTPDGSVFMCEAFRYHALHCNTALNELETAIEEERERADTFMEAFPVSNSNSKYEDEEELRQASQQPSTALDDANRSRSRQVSLALPASKDRSEQYVIPGQNSDEFNAPSLNRSSFKSALWGMSEQQSIGSRPTSPSASTPYINMTSRPPSPLSIAPLNSEVYDSRPVSSAERLPGTSRRTTEMYDSRPVSSAERLPGSSRRTTEMYDSRPVSSAERLPGTSRRTTEMYDSRPVSSAERLPGTSRRTTEMYDSRPVSSAERLPGTSRRTTDATPWINTPSTSRYGEVLAESGAYESGYDFRESQYPSQALEGQESYPAGVQSGSVRTIHRFTPRAENSRASVRRKPSKKFVVHRFVSRNNNASKATQERPTRDEISGDVTHRSSNKSSVDCNRNNTYKMVIVEAGHDLGWDGHDPAAESRRPRTRCSRNSSSESEPPSRRDDRSQSPESINLSRRNNRRKCSELRQAKMKDAPSPTIESRKLRAMDSSNLPSELGQPKKKESCILSAESKQAGMRDTGGYSPGSRSPQVRDVSGSSSKSSHHYVLDKGGGTSPVSIQHRTRLDRGSVSPELRQHTVKNSGCGAFETRHPNMRGRDGDSPELIQLWTEDRGGGSTESLQTWEKDADGSFSDSKHPTIRDGSSESRHRRMGDASGGCRESGNLKIRDFGSDSPGSRHSRMGDAGGGCEESRHPRVRDRGGSYVEPRLPSINARSDDLTESAQDRINGGGSCCSESSQPWSRGDGGGLTEGKLQKKADASCDASDAGGTKRTRFRVQWATAPGRFSGLDFKPLNLSLCEVGHDPSLSAFSLYRPEN